MKPSRIEPGGAEAESGVESPSTRAAAVESPALRELRDWVLLGEPAAAVIGGTAEQRARVLGEFERECDGLLHSVRIRTPGLRLVDVCSLALGALGAQGNDDPRHALLEVARRSLETCHGVVLIFETGSVLAEATAARLVDLAESSTGCLRIVVASAGGAGARPLFEALGPDLVRISAAPGSERRRSRAWTLTLAPAAVGAIAAFALLRFWSGEVELPPVDLGRSEPVQVAPQPAAQQTPDESLPTQAPGRPLGPDEWAGVPAPALRPKPIPVQRVTALRAPTIVSIAPLRRNAGAGER